MDHRQPPSLAPGERLNKYGQVYNFEEWKASKIADGTWINSVDEWKQRKQNGSLPSVSGVSGVSGAPLSLFPTYSASGVSGTSSPAPFPPSQSFQFPPSQSFQFPPSQSFQFPPSQSFQFPPSQSFPFPPYSASGASGASSSATAAPMENIKQFPSRVLPPPGQMGEGTLEEQPKFNIIPPAPEPIPIVSLPPSKPKGSKKLDEWIPLKDFIENRKRRNEEYTEREQKVIRMSDQYESSDDMSRRVVIFDTETTGLGKEHEIVEIAMIETIEGIKTGRYLHFFINPDGENTKKAYEIHRLTKESLASHPKFWQVASKIASFIGSSSLMAHNAEFDMGMINRGMIKAGLKPYPPERFICTQKMFKSLFPGEPANQNYACHKFGVDNFNRETTGIHSAIEDTTQLYHVFRGMIPLLEKKNLCWSEFRLP